MSRDQAKIAIEKLVERFAEHRKAYHAPDYNEAKTRQDFINPFFKALGWDIDNEKGASEAYREVIYEDKVVVRGKAKAPDYGFRLMGQGKKRLFYVEAKKPSVSLKANKETAYQLRRYGSSAQAPVSILTNFEEFIIYDCSKVPNLNDSASVARLKHIGFEDYIKEFDFIYDTFSHDAVTRGRFDKFVQSDANKKGSQTLDKEFVQSLDTWRKYLATSIAVNNKKINDEELNFCVQLIIDRLIFLRFCEDRSVEPYGQLQSAASKGNAYNNLFELFEQADTKYNSGLFDFEKDQLTSKLKIDNKVVKNIVEDLYYPQCRYEFSVMPVEVLGNAYEQFLGKVIRILPSRGVKIEEKPEVRKAGGVFYTPQYIVEYIVKNTVGKLIDGKAPKEIDKIKIVDPACGSGSFLVGAFEYLLNYHTDWYHKNLSEKEKKKGDIITPDGKLTTHEKKRILINNIYGVDIDANAVEVSKLSLLLKCMEGETEASIRQQVTMFHERILPDLDNNIKDGNSLIDRESELSFQNDLKIKPFDWKKRFPQVYKQNGFDIVIGNPPYLRMQGLQETQPESLEYFRNNYEAAKSGNFDLYVLFDERGFNLLNENGILGFIQPHKFFQADFGEGVRNLFSKQKALAEIVNFGAQQVFEDATTYTCLLFLSKQKQKEVTVRNVNDLLVFAMDNSVSETFTSKQPEINTKWNFVSKDKQSLFEKLYKQNKSLGDITRKIFVGLQTSADKIYVLDIIKEKSKTFLVYSKSLERELEIEKGIVKLFLMGKDVKRYESPQPTHVVLFPYTIGHGSAKLMPSTYIKSKFPLGWKYIYENKKELEGREHNKMKGEQFYAYIYPKNLVEFEVEKICTPDIADKPKFTIDKSRQLYHTTTVYSIAFNEGILENEKYFLGLLNSSVLWYFLKNTGNVLRGGFFRFKTEYLKPFPIKLINFNLKTEVQKHDEIVKQVNLVLEANKELKEETLPNTIEQIKQRIEHCEDKINSLVYELYELSAGEIKIVEGGLNE
jgi:type I restriction-modification system DNA methylase subunit